MLWRGTNGTLVWYVAWVNSNVTKAIHACTRRKFLGSAAQFAAGLALTPQAAIAQLPAPEPIEDAKLTFITTTEQKPWQPGRLFRPAFGYEVLNLNLDPTSLQQSMAAAHTLDGFGACFNELGWTSLSALADPDRDAVLHELFHPQAGARFTLCRMPIAANDFATGPYSYDDHDGDFALKHFSIDHDRTTLVPFIHAAQRHQPALKLWASPWSPPAWMKTNHFYAEAASRPGIAPNGIRPDQIGHEGEDVFIQKSRYFEAYARYFGRFIEAYRAENIPIDMVMPQNEFNSAQNFPSCTWTPAGLARFLAYLGPEMQRLGVDIFFGTLERGNPRLFEAVMADPKAAACIKGIGVQWAGKNALSTLHSSYPNLKLYQSEQECGDGSNSWTYTSYCWQLMKTYLRNGARAYMYWNIAIAQGVPSTWGWSQNSLISIDPHARTYRFNHDYYLLKHLTHFVDTGAIFVPTTGTCDDALAFRNPDGSFVFLVRNPEPHAQQVQVQALTRSVQIELPPDSVGTLVLKA